MMTVNDGGNTTTVPQLKLRRCENTEVQHFSDSVCCYSDTPNCATISPHLFRSPSSDATLSKEE